MNTWGGGTQASGAGGYNSGVSPLYSMGRMFVGPFLSGGQSITGSTVGYNVGVALSESNAAMNLYHRTFAYVFRSGTGNAKTLIGPVSDTVEHGASEVGCIIVATGAATNFSINTNDRIVVEEWFDIRNTKSTTYQGTFYYNGTADIVEASGTSNAASFIILPTTFVDWNSIQTINQNATLKTPTSRTISQNSTLKKSTSQTLSQNAQLQIATITTSQTINQNATLKTVTSQTLNQNAFLDTTTQQTIPQNATLKTVTSQPLSQNATLKTLTNQTLSQNAFLDTTTLQTVTQNAGLRTPYFSSTYFDSDYFVTDAIAAFTTQTLTQNATLKTITSQTLSQNSTLKTITQQTLSQNSALKTVTSQTLSQNSTLKALTSQTLNQNAFLKVSSVTTSQIINQNATLKTLTSRTLDQNAQLTQPGLVTAQPSAGWGWWRWERKKQRFSHPRIKFKQTLPLTTEVLYPYSVVLELTFWVSNHVQQPHELRWDVSEHVQKLYKLQWNVSENHSQNFALRWNVSNPYMRKLGLDTFVDLDREETLEFLLLMQLLEGEEE